MKKIGLLLNIILFVFCVSLPSISSADEVKEAKTQLQEISEQLEFIRKTGMHLQDEGRIYILQQVVTAVKNSIEEKGIGNVRTLNFYQQLIIKFRFSTQFFEFVRTTSTEKQIANILSAVKDIREKRGFDDDPYSKILKSNLEQMFNSLTQLARASSTPSNIKQQIRALTPLFGVAIALADQGDRPKAFAKATEIFQSLRSMYGALQSLSGSPAAFRYVLEVMGLNEFIGEYSQVERI